MLTKYMKVIGSDWQSWRWQLQNQIRQPAELSELLGLSHETLVAIEKVHARYPLRITPYYLSLAKTGSLDDPILRQCLPDLAELDEANCGAPDALNEQGSSPLPNLVHRYPDRVLFITGNFCATHCRHCMRKRHWGVQMSPPSSAEIKAVAAYLQSKPGIREVLISGGDPLLLAEDKLEEIIRVLSAVPSLQTLRFGSRVPTVLPQRMTVEFCRLLASGKAAWLATHFNHVRELTAEAAEAADNLLRAGIPVVNQSVLLKGVNDSVEALGDLFTGLLRLKIKPYYLFHGDPIQGTMHFRTGVEKGLEILDALRGNISGLALPAYAFDLPGGAGKVRLEPNVTIGKNAEGNTVYRSYQGLEIPYQ